MAFRFLPADKKKRVILYTLLGVLFMFGFSYMMVPLYTLVCQNIGLNGRTKAGPSVMDKGMAVDTSRVIDVEFTGTVHDDFPFVFKPLVHHIKIHPGEKKLVYYYAQNQTGHPLTVQAIPSIMPDDSAKYLKKTECFCFTQQYFFKGEKANMPVYFYVDPAIPKRTKSMVLSYTLYDVKQYLKKDEQFYRKGRIDIK